MVELLAPVRDEVSLTAAMDAGADAVYFGLGQLNMRASSRGFEPAALPEVVARAHARKVRVYITVNTLIYENELADLDVLLAQIKAADADAVICWDPAVIHRCRSLGIPVHISTQASVANVEAVKFYESLGARCIVLARELTLEQIHAIRQQTSLKIEAFVHGAMCLSVSGRCFLSQYLAGRSANRGECHQPCRRRYRLTDIETGDEIDVGTDYLISPKDLCTLPILDQLIAAGIDIFKIEGRSRPPEYVKIVTAAYRRPSMPSPQGRLARPLSMDYLRKYQRSTIAAFPPAFFSASPRRRIGPIAATTRRPEKRLISVKF